MKSKLIRCITGCAIGLVGITLVWLAAGWMAAIGVFLMIWGNNVERRNDIEEIVHNKISRSLIAASLLRMGRKP